MNAKEHLPERNKNPSVQNAKITVSVLSAWCITDCRMSIISSTLRFCWRFRTPNRPRRISFEAPGATSSDRPIERKAQKPQEQIPGAPNESFALSYSRVGWASITLSWNLIEETAERAWFQQKNVLHTIWEMDVFLRLNPQLHQLTFIHVLSHVH